MKKTITLIAVIGLAACTGRQPESDMILLPAEEEIVFKAYTEAQPQTRAALQEDGKSIWWEPEDQIKVFRGDDSGVFTAQLDESAADADFKGAFSSPSATGNSFFAVYPASAVQSYDGSYLTVVIPSEQKARKGSFDRNAFISVAKSSNHNLYFKNLCGGIKFSLSRSDIDRVEITSFLQDGLVGTICYKTYNFTKHTGYSFTDKTIVLTPAEGSFFESGAFYYAVCVAQTGVRYLRISLYSGGNLVGIYDSPVSRSFQKSVFGVIHEVDNHLGYAPEDFPAPDAIDLGLPSGKLWASFNLGATSPEESGAYYAWGETVPKPYYDWSTYIWCNGSYKTITKYNSSSSNGIVDGKRYLDPEDDAASAILGPDWHMPTMSDVAELRTYCNWTWSNLNGVNGYYVESKSNGNRIFIPASGRYRYNAIEGANTEGHYFCNYRDYSSENYILSDISTLLFTSSAVIPVNQASSFSHGSRTYGLPLRPVRNATTTEASSVTVTPSSLTLNRGESYQLYATVYPTSLNDKRVTWSSDNVAVATVDASGLLTAMGAGTANITATAIAGGVSSSCVVTVFNLTESVSINHSAVDLVCGESIRLEANVLPEDATNKEITWESDNMSVATVDIEGVVKGISPGSAIITVKTVDSGQKATCRVTVISELHKVDMGLPSGTLWGDFNLGAYSPSGLGNAYSWGDISPKNSQTYTDKWFKGGYIKYNLEDHLEILELEDDAAAAVYGDLWHIPTLYEQLELLNPDYCNWSAEELDGVHGYRVTSRINGASIFMPDDYYWTSSLNPSTRLNGYYDCSYACELKVSESGGSAVTDNYRIEIGSDGTVSWQPDGGAPFRSVGHRVRPVYGIRNETVAVQPERIESEIQSISLEVGKNVKCHAIIYPTWSYARQNIVWSSSDASVATITPDGFLTGINKGDCVITASTPDGVITKGYNVYVERSMTPVAVDLGLPSGTKWAAFNLFATSPEEYGSYFAWGDTSPNNNRFIWDTYLWWSPTEQLLRKYCTHSTYGPVDNLTELEPGDDAARHYFGDKWRIPNEADFMEMVANCTKRYDSIGDVIGVRYTSKINGNSIFLPAAGVMVDRTLVGAGVNVYFVTSTLSYDPREMTCYILSGSGSSYPYRCYGYPIRPVYKE